MTTEELKVKISELHPSVTYEEGGDPIAIGWLNMNIDAADWLSFAQQLRHDASLHFDYLFCLTCIDWKTHLTMVYHLSSTIFRHNHEREVYEMFGVNFLNHPDLRLLILPDGWEGKNPMRKDFEDPVNMIRL